MPRVLLVLAAGLVLARPAPALAHDGGVAYVEVELRGRELALTLRSTVHNLSPALGLGTLPRASAEMYGNRRGTVARNVMAYVTVVDGQRRVCRPRSPTVQLRKERIVEVAWTCVCPRRPARVELRYDLLFDQDPGHRAFVRLLAGEGAARREVRQILDARHRTVSLTHEVSAWSTAGEFLLLGAEHIFTGYDHVLFLVVLLLAAGAAGASGGIRRGLYQVLAIVTSFTVAHSITLVAAALEWVALPSRIVEPAIAATIIYVALENVVVTAPRHRWVLTFLFGLVHGFGFAHVLGEIGLPGQGLAVALACFNVGVELGQVIAVTLLFPVVYLLARGRVGLPAALLCVVLVGLLLALITLAGLAMSWQPVAALGLLVAGMVAARRLGYRRAIQQGGSLLVAALGAVWLVARVFGLSVLGGLLGG